MFFYIKFILYLGTSFAAHKHRLRKTFLILFTLNNRISYDWLFQILQIKYISKFVGWNLSKGRNAHELLDGFFLHVLAKFR